MSLLTDDPLGFRRLVGSLQPADEASRVDFEALVLSDDLYTVLAEHHEVRGQHSYWIAHDPSAVWGPPGEPHLIAIFIHRRHDRGYFTCTFSTHALLALAQRWLIRRGCPESGTQPLDTVDHPAPADEVTCRIEKTLRSPSGRLEVLDHYTREPRTAQEHFAVHVLAHAPGFPGPFRIFCELLRPDFTYMLREGAFPDRKTADNWLELWHTDPATPLPPLSDPPVPASPEAG